MTKKILLATFIFPERIDWYSGYLSTKYGILKDQIHIYENLEDESKLIVTFRLTVEVGKYIDLKENFPSAVQVHKKGTTFYSINALNKVIAKDSGLTKGSTDFTAYKVDWTKYQNTMILTNKDELSFLPIKRIF